MNTVTIHLALYGWGVVVINEYYYSLYSHIMDLKFSVLWCYAVTRNQ